jgi:hypothetical protein
MTALVQKVLDLLPKRPYVGTIADIAGPENHGLMNDHLAILHYVPDGKWRVVLRKGFNPSAGLRQVDYETNEVWANKDRGYGTIETVVKDADERTARKLAFRKARKEGVVLYVSKSTPSSVVLWHPRQWQPKYA